MHFSEPANLLICLNFFAGIMECIRTCVFYVITASNFVIRKRCDHKDIFDCDCDIIDFDVVLIDYDYVHEEGTDIQDPRHTGTLQYRALPLLVCTWHILMQTCCMPTRPQFCP